tara:strand:- start:351 stop:530 length:180 start_codon:yes stop_codon:yes gene_type:complete
VELAGADLGGDQGEVQLVFVDVAVDAGVAPFFGRQGLTYFFQSFDYVFHIGGLLLGNHA